MSMEAASLLEATGWLSNVPAQFREPALDACVCSQLDPGQSITHGGEETGGVFGIVSGSAGVYAAIGSSEAPLIHIAGSGYWFGLFPIVGDRPRIISVMARSNCLVAQLPMTALQNMLDQKPEYWRWISLLALESAALAVQGLADLLIGDKERRCAAVLLRIAGCRDTGDTPATAHLTQDELAGLSNLSRPTVSLVVRRLAARGLVSPGYKAIAIPAPASLRKFVR